MRSLATRCLVALAAIAGLSACGGGTAPSAAFKAGQPPKAAPLPAPAAAPAAPAYIYNPIGKRDPFRSPDLDLARASAVSNSACNEPLCKFDLDQLTLVGVVSGDSNPVAMVQDPQGRGYILHRNTRIGRQGGKVTQILRDSVIITEYFTSPDGKSNANQLTLAIKADRQAPPELDLSTGKIY
ncbi:MAG: pilus assembly protein PilP [Myxococcaceae bacterium]